MCVCDCWTAGRKEELSIAGFGVSVTTMEEVFLKVKEEVDESIESKLQRKGTLRRAGERERPAECVSPPPPPGIITSV